MTDLSKFTSDKVILKRIVVVRSTFFMLGPMDRWDLGPADPLQWICKEWVQELSFDETTVNVEGGDDWVGIKNKEMDKLMIRGNKLLIR